MAGARWVLRTGRVRRRRSAHLGGLRPGAALYGRHAGLRGWRTLQRGRQNRRQAIRPGSRRQLIRPGPIRKSRAILAYTQPPLAGFEVLVALAIVALLAWSLWRVLQELQGHTYRRTQNPTQLTNQIAGLLEMGEARGAAAIARDTIPRLIQSEVDVRIRRRAAILAGRLATSKAARVTDKMKKALVNALGDPDRYLRRLAIESLLKMNGGEPFGYEPDAPELERAAAQKKWRKWLQPRRRFEPSAAQADQRPKPPAGIDKEALRRQIERKLGIQPTWGPRIENLPADLRE